MERTGGQMRALAAAPMRIFAAPGRSREAGALPSAHPAGGEEGIDPYSVCILILLGELP